MYRVARRASEVAVAEVLQSGSTHTHSSSSCSSSSSGTRAACARHWKQKIAGLHSTAAEEALR